MRSKFQCNESSFISLVKTMYLLDDSDSMKDKFKLVRIKNKLDTPSNNIMINYLFGDVLFKFRHFFRTVDNMDSKFLYTI